MEKLDILKILLTLSEVYRITLSETAFDLYVTSLEDLPFNEIRDSIFKCLKDYDFFPTIAQIRRKCASSEKSDNRILNMSENSWAQIISSIQQLSPEDSIDFEDSILAETISQLFYGGWPELFNYIKNSPFRFELSSNIKNNFKNQYTLNQKLLNSGKNFSRHLCGTIENLSKSPSPYIRKESFKTFTWTLDGEFIQENKI